MTDFQEVDTAQVQALSLNRFMEGLGYRPKFNGDGKSSLGRLSFVTDKPDLNMMRSLSVNTAVKLHNAKPEDWEEFAKGWFRYPGLELAINVFDLVSLYARRVVMNVKWQKNKNAAGGIRLTSNMVKLANPVFAGTVGVVLD